MPPEVQETKSSVHIGALLITLLLLGIAVFVSFNYKKVGNQNVIIPTSSGTIQQMAPGKLPPDMPADVVLAKDAKIISSYTGITPDGQKQSTLVYTTSEKPTNLLTEYLQYLYKNGWAMKSQGTGEKATSYSTQKIIFVKNLNPLITLSIVVMDDNSGTNTWIVSINLLAPSNSNAQ